MSSFDYAQAAHDATILNAYVAERLAAMSAEGARTQRYADALATMDPIDSLVFLWLLMCDPTSLSNLPSLE